MRFKLVAKKEYFGFDRATVLGIQAAQVLGQLSLHPVGAL